MGSMTPEQEARNAWTSAPRGAICHRKHSFVRLYEEPTLTRRFGAEYEAYRS